MPWYSCFALAVLVGFIILIVYEGGKVGIRRRLIATALPFLLAYLVCWLAFTGIVNGVLGATLSEKICYYSMLIIQGGMVLSALLFGILLIRKNDYDPKGSNSKL